MPIDVSHQNKSDSDSDFSLRRFIDSESLIDSIRHCAFLISVWSIHSKIYCYHSRIYCFTDKYIPGNSWSYVLEPLWILELALEKTHSGCHFFLRRPVKTVNCDLKTVNCDFIAAETKCFLKKSTHHMFSWLYNWLFPEATQSLRLKRWSLLQREGVYLV